MTAINRNGKTGPRGPKTQFPADSGCSLSAPLAEKLAAIDRLKSDFTVHMLCQTLDVLKSTYYHHALRSPVKKQY